MADFNSIHTGATIDTAVTATSAIPANTTHRGSDGKDHSDVVTNTTDIGTNTTAIGLNTTHRTSTGADHTYIDQSVVSGATPTFTGTNFTGIPDGGLSSDATVISAGAGDSGKLVKLDSAGHVDASAINDADINLDNVTEGSTNKFFTATEETKLVDAVISDETGVTGADQILNMMSLTQVEYDAIGTPVSTTLYFISG